MVEVHRRMDWQTLLTYITGSVEQGLLLRNEYLVSENRILHHQIQGRVRLNDGARQTLAEIGQRKLAMGRRRSRMFSYRKLGFALG